ncbi:DNA polymerase kappa [Hypoxylon sp. FL1857]|nr:DNA polymerase kappa [Hypoxylon sp. FL1857]
MTEKLAVPEPDLHVTEADSSKQDDRQHDTLKYHLLGPSLTKAGQDSVDQSKVSEIIYNASKGSKYFNHEEVRDKVLTQKIQQILEKKRRLEKLDLTRELRAADQFIIQLEASRDLTQSIVHIDCDAFYAAVEQLDRPELKDLPFAVGGGVLTTCNYVARKFGCRSGMAGFVAKKLCPDLLLLPLNFDKYTSKAEEVRQVLAQYDPRFESASIDEAYLNITEYCAEHNLTPGDAVQQMRDEIHEKTKITVSAGIAANAKLAKICSNMNKPNGQYVLPNDRNAIMTFMRDLPTRKVNGIGRVLERELQEIGIKTCSDIYPHRQFLYVETPSSFASSPPPSFPLLSFPVLSINKLHNDVGFHLYEMLICCRRQLFGEKTYEFLITCYLGLGRTEVQPAEEYERKSVGTESTFRDMSDPVQLREKLRWTAEELEKDMRRAECKGRTLVLKVKLHTYEVLTRQVVTPRAICAADDLYNYSLPILAKLEQEKPGMKLRLMGLRCTHLISTKKPDARAFFGLRPLKTDTSHGTSDGLGNPTTSETVQTDGVTQGRPECTLYDGNDQLDSRDTRIGIPQGAEEDSYRHHGKEIVPNPKRRAPTQEPEEWWDCPICSRPQPTNERLFNEHIDLCLSRKAIRDTVQQDYVRSPASTADMPAPKRLKSGGEKKRSRTSTPVDPRQTKLFFG